MRGELWSQQVVDQLGQQRLGLRRFQHGEAGVELGFDGVPPQERAAEGVDRADLRRIETAKQLQPVVALAPAGPAPAARGTCRGCGRAFRARRSVNVIATKSLKSQRGVAIDRPGSRCDRNRSVSTNVLPQPAPAERATDTSRDLDGGTLLVREGGWRDSVLARRGRLPCLLQGPYGMNSAHSFIVAAPGALFVVAVHGELALLNARRRDWRRVVQAVRAAPPIARAANACVGPLVEDRPRFGIETRRRGRANSRRARASRSDPPATNLPRPSRTAAIAAS